MSKRATDPFGIIKGIAVIALCVLLVAAVAVDIGYGVFMSLDRPEQTGYNYLTDQDPIDTTNTHPAAETNPDEKRWFIEANYYSNENKNGIELGEVKFHHFSDPSLTAGAADSITMQYVGEYHEEVRREEIEVTNDYVDPRFYYYSTFLDVTADWKGLQTQLKRNEYLIVKIDGEAYRTHLDGSYVYDSKTTGWWLWEKTITTYYIYDYGDLFGAVMHGIKTTNVGEGTWYTKLDISNFFTNMEKWDAATNDWVKMPTDFVKNYCVVKFHYSKDGANSARQSLAHIIADNPAYDTNPESVNADYWQERVQYRLTAQDFSYRYSEAYNGYLLSLPLSMQDGFKNLARAEINVDIDLGDEYLTSRDINLVGLDYNAFDGFRLKDLTLRGAGTFTLCGKSLNDTKLKTLHRSAELTLDFAPDAINTTYTEVIL